MNDWFALAFFFSSFTLVTFLLNRYPLLGLATQHSPLCNLCYALNVPGKASSDPCRSSGVIAPCDGSVNRKGNAVSK